MKTYYLGIPILLSSLLGGCVTDNRHVYMQPEWTVREVICSAGTHANGDDTVDPDLLQVNDVIRPWRFWFWRGVSATRGDQKLFRLTSILPDKKDVFGVHVAAPNHRHCVAIQYRGNVNGNRQTSYIFVKTMNAQSVCNAEFISEDAKENIAGCDSSHEGAWGAW